MSVQLKDVGLPVLTITVLSPLAILFFRLGIPIEVIVFGLLLAGYKGPHWLQAFRSRGLEKACAAKSNEGHSDSDTNDHASPQNSPEDSARSKGAKSPSSGGVSWRHGLSWRPKKSPTDQDESPGWRKSGGKKTPKGDDAGAKKDAPRSALSALKQSTPGLQWRSIINKFTPEKFDKLCEQLLATLPGAPPPEGEAAPEKPAEPVTSETFKNILEELLALIFQASSRQHLFTEMYTDLCGKLLDYVAKQRPELDGRGVIWTKCQHIFLTTVLKAPEIPDDLPEDEQQDRKAKHKHMMVGMVKFGGDLVSHGLVPCDGVMCWIHTLLSEKHQEVYTAEACDEAGDSEAREKDAEQREVQLEVLCAILASMGSSLSDRNTWSEENRLVIEDVFMQLEQLSMDTQRLSLRIRCLIRDILDLRMAQWKEKEGKLKPQMLEKRKTGADEDESDLRTDAPEFSPGRGAWSSERSEGKQWLDPQLITSLTAVEHHLEIIEDKEAKLERLKKLIQLYHIIQEKQFVIVANTSNVRRVNDLMSESFGDVGFQSLDFQVPEATRKASIKDFESGKTSVVVMSSEVSTRKDFDLNKSGFVLVNFDFPMTLQLYLYRIYRRADSSNIVYTFFTPQYDIRHTVPLMLAIEAAKQKAPPALLKLKEHIKAQTTSDQKGGGETRHKDRDRDAARRNSKADGKGEGEEDRDRAERGDKGGAEWKHRRGSDNDDWAGEEPRYRARGAGATDAPTPSAGGSEGGGRERREDRDRRGPGADEKRGAGAGSAAEKRAEERRGDDGLRRSAGGGGKGGDAGKGGHGHRREERRSCDDGDDGSDVGAEERQRSGKWRREETPTAEDRGDESRRSKQPARGADSGDNENSMRHRNAERRPLAARTARSDTGAGDRSVAPNSDESISRQESGRAPWFESQESPLPRDQRRAPSDRREGGGGHQLDRKGLLPQRVSTGTAAPSPTGTGEKVTIKQRGGAPEGSSSFASGEARKEARPKAAGSGAERDQRNTSGPAQQLPRR